MLLHSAAGERLQSRAWNLRSPEKPVEALPDVPVELLADGAAEERFGVDRKHRVVHRSGDPERHLHLALLIAGGRDLPDARDQPRARLARERGRAGHVYRTIEAERTCGERRQLSSA